MRSDLWCIVPVLCLLAAATAALAVSSTTPEKSAAERLWSSLRQPRPPIYFELGGQPAARLLPGWQREERGGKTVLSDEASGLQLALAARRWADPAAVEWVVQVANRGKTRSPLLDDIKPLDLTLPAGPEVPVTIHYARGDTNSASSFEPLQEELAVGKSLDLHPGGGRSSDPYLPFFAVQVGDGGVALAIGWSGQWEVTFTRTSRGLRVLAGMQHTHLRLEPGESIRTPRILLVPWEGGDPLRGSNLLRQALLKHYLPRRNGKLVMPPICGSTGEVAADGSYEPAHLRVMQPFAKAGIEVFWSDMDPQQWYPIGFPDGTGTWEVDPVKYPHGLAPIGQAAHDAGLGYLLWFEPERVHTGTRIEQLHPEWLLPKEGGDNCLFALNIPHARTWLTDYIDQTITAAKLDWLRWDFNIEPLGFWRRSDAPERQGMTEIRYIEGLYAMWEDLERRHPGLVVDLCASGGRRIDLESLRYGLPLWHSDMHCFGTPAGSADQLQNAGLTRWVPLHGCAAFGYEPSYAFRSAMTAGNILCADNAAPGNEAAIKGTVAAYQQARTYLVGDFYPLFPHVADETAWSGYQLDRPDLRSGMAVLFRRPQAPARQGVHLAALNPKARYEVTFPDTGKRLECTGAELARLAVEIVEAPGSAVVVYREK